MGRVCTRSSVVRGTPAWLRGLTAGAAIGFFVCGPARAFDIPLDNPDYTLRFDSTVQYTLGFRTEAPDAAIYRNPFYTESDLEYQKFDINMARLDLLSSFDLDYQNWAGFRISAAGWIDTSFSDTLNTVPAGTPDYTAQSYTNFYYNPFYPTFKEPYSALSDFTNNGQYDDYIKRFYGGPSGEIRDVFAYGNFKFHGVPVNVKVGQFSQFWGESLYDYIDGVSYSQAPIDIDRGLRAPGTEAKNLVLPLPQIAATSQITQALSAGLQYYLDWAPSRIPAAGTYFGTQYPVAGTDTRYFTLLAAPTDFNGGSTPIHVPFAGYDKPHNDAAWGFYTRYRPHWLWGSTVGFYYRHFDEMYPWVLMHPVSRPGPIGEIFSYANYEAVYNRGAQLIGLSLEKNYRRMTFGGELVMRRGTALQTAVAPSPSTAAYNSTTDPAPADLDPGKGARGNTVHALLNVTGVTGPIFLWDELNWSAEASWAHLVQVTDNSSIYTGVGYGGCMLGYLGGDPIKQATTPATKSDGCATSSYIGLRASASPTWYDVRPQVNLSLPISIGTGLQGNSPVLYGGNEGAGSWSAGAALDYRHRYDFELAYNDYLSHYNTSNGIVVTSNTTGSGLYNDRGWVSFTFRTSF